MRDFPQYLAFDLGASHGRAVLGTLDEGRMRLEELHRFATPLLEAGERLFWDLDALWEEIQTGLRHALEAAPHLRSLSVDSWAVDYVPLGEEGQPLRNAYCYRDGRVEGMMQKAFAEMPREKIFATTGIQFLPFNTLYQVLSDQEIEPDCLRRTHGRLFIADYFHHRFGGRPATDVSMASTTQLMGVRTFEWATGLMEQFDIDPAKWPEIVPSGTKLGPAHLEKSKIEVVAGCSHDTACAVAAVPAVSGTNWAYVSCGTWSLLGVECNEPIVTPEACEAGFTNEVGLDGAIRFLKNLSGFWPLEECIREWEADGTPVDYGRLFAEAEAAPTSAAPLDLEDPRFLARGGMEKRLLSYCREQGQPVPASRGALVRLILESIADSYRRTLHDVETLTGQPVEVLHLVGGGARNDLLCRLATEACGCPVIAGPVEATALGNLLIQARTMGDLPPDISIRDVVRRSADLKRYETQHMPAT